MRKEEGEPYYRINVDEAVEMYGENDVAVVDVRRLDEYTAGHIKDAIFIPVDDVLARIDELPKDKRLLFICSHGRRSGLACEMAAAMGLDPEKLFNIEDGTSLWLEKGYAASYGNTP